MKPADKKLVGKEVRLEMFMQSVCERMPHERVERSTAEVIVHQARGTIDRQDVGKRHHYTANPLSKVGCSQSKTGDVWLMSK